MLMFYKKAFYEHRLIDEYQEGYGVGEDVGQANGIKIGEARGRKLGRKLGISEGQMLERENIIRKLSKAGMSNDTISISLNIPLEKVEEILNQKSLKLKRVH